VKKAVRWRITIDTGPFPMKGEKEGEVPAT
jgi:hypothetical protein